MPGCVVVADDESLVRVEEGPEELPAFLKHYQTVMGAAQPAAAADGLSSNVDNSDQQLVIGSRTDKHSSDRLSSSVKQLSDVKSRSMAERVK